MKVERKAKITERKTVSRKKRPPLKRGQQRPDFNTLFDGSLVDDPFENVVYTGDMEVDSAAEVSEVLQAIKREKAERRDRYRLLTDTEFWIAVCFQSREQKEEFLEKVGWLSLGDKYIDGLALAELVGVDVEPIPLEAPAIKKAPKGLRRYNLILEGGDS
jgi:hypothetical protein